jgi:DNA-binding NtrC family response regulator
MAHTVLLVEDRTDCRQLLAGELHVAGFDVVEARDGRDGVSHFDRGGSDLVVSHFGLPQQGGMALLGRIRECSRIPVILYADDARTPEVVHALRSGADDFLVLDRTQPRALIDAVRAWAGCSTAVDAGAIEQEIVGESAATRRVRDLLRALAPLGEPVLLRGEPGSGRSAAARALSRAVHSPLPPRVLRCDELATLPEPRGGGTVHLREATSLARHVQEELLERIGQPMSGDPRWIVSTDASLDVDVKSGRFDAELARRLRRFEVHLPPLRARPEDVPRIARHLAERAGRELGRPCVKLSEAALGRLRDECWPGNVSELAGAVERLVAFAEDARIDRSDMEAVLGDVRLSVEGLRDLEAQQERAALLVALAESGGNVTRTARLLGRSRAAVYRMVEKHGVPLRRAG